MESEDSTRDSSGVDDFELMCVVAQTIINNNVVLMRYLSKKCSICVISMLFLSTLVLQHILRGIYQDNPKPSFDTMRMLMFVSKGMTTWESQVI